MQGRLEPVLVALGTNEWTEIVRVSDRVGVFEEDPAKGESAVCARGGTGASQRERAQKVENVPEAFCIWVARENVNA